MSDREADRGFQSAMRKASRAFWMQRAREMGLQWGDTIIVWSRCFREQEAFSETLTFHYIDASHLHGKSEGGCIVGLPTCSVINVEYKGE